MTPPETPEPSRDTLIRAAERRVTRRECPFCGHDAWDTAPDVAVIYYAGDVLIGGNPGPGFGAIPFACTNCGYIRFHAERTLQRATEEH